MVFLRGRLGGLNRRVQGYLLYSHAWPTTLTRIFGKIHGMVMYAFYGTRSSQTILEPRHYLARLLKPGDTYVDIGASFGDTIRIAVDAVGNQGTIYAFEPQTEVFQQLVQMIERFGWDTVTPIQTLVGNHTGASVMYTHPTNRRISSTSPAWNNIESTPISYPITKLDDWVAAQGVNSVDFIKIDVEGAELQVVRGAKTLLSTNRPTLLMEINNRKLRRDKLDYTIDDLLSELRQAGYRHFQVLRLEGLVSFDEEADLQEADRDMIAHAEKILP